MQNNHSIHLIILIIVETRILNLLPTHPTAAVAGSLGASLLARFVILPLPALPLTTG